MLEQLELRKLRAGNIQNKFKGACMGARLKRLTRHTISLRSCPRTRVYTNLHLSCRYGCHAMQTHTPPSINVDGTYTAVAKLAVLDQKPVLGSSCLHPFEQDKT